MIALPLAQYWARSNEEVLRLQPYVAVSHGKAPPQTTVLLDYISLSRFKVIFRAIRLRHGLVILSTLIYFATLLFQPLAASLFTVKATQFVMQGSVGSTSKLGLRPDFNDLNAFSAAAGYAEAAVLHNLGDPPFVWEGWSMATFNVTTVRDTITKNGTVLINSVATQTDPKCSVASTSTPVVAGNGSYTVAGSYGGCSASFTSEPNTRENFGVTLANGCTNGLEDKFKPVMFWFFTPYPPTASMIFCAPSVQIFEITANVSISDNTLQYVEVVNKWGGVSNVTSGTPLNGLALNG